MKGVEESLSQTIFIIGAILAAVILIYMASIYLSGLGKENTTELSGDKNFVLGEIKSISEKCWKDFGGRKTAEICAKTYLNESTTISSDEIIGYFKGSIIPAGSIKAENITGPAEIAVTYKDSLIFIEER